MTMMRPQSSIALLKSQLACVLYLIGQNGSSPVFSDWLDGSLCEVCKSKVNIFKFENKSETVGVRAPNK